MSSKRKKKVRDVPLRTIDERGVERTTVYDHVFIPDDDPWPRFTVVHPPRHPEQTDKQDWWSRRDTERFHRAMSVMLGTSWIAATHLGYHRTCPESSCRRMGRCAGRRREDDWAFPGPCFPPCADAAGKDEVRPISNELTAILAAWMPIYKDQIASPPLEELMHAGITRLPPGALEEALARIERRRRQREAE